MHETILTLAQAVTGAGSGESALLDALCSAAGADWLARLRPGLTAGDCGDAFTCAAAFTAAADLLSGRAGTESAASFTAGDFSVRAVSAAEQAAAADTLRASAARLMAPYAEDGAFSIRGVRG